MTTRTMPRPGITPHIAPMTISALINDLKQFDPDKSQRDRYVMGLPLAPWQREFKWSDDQARRFIHSAWTGVHLGTYVVTEFELRPEIDGFRGIEFMPLSNCVIDGQQRLKALEMFLTDQLAVADSEGRLTLWSEVDARDRRRFQNTIFSRGIIRERDETKLRATYDLMNFGGSPHLESERAMPQPRLVRVGNEFFVDRSDTASLTAAQEQARHEAVFRYSQSRSPAAELVRARLDGADAGIDDDVAGEEAPDAPRPR
ncbi:DUF262 domain-containing protein [Variovorax sp. RA8]|uniref:DUF262 domain-containing protein n=1 Tax=Variovorax sp. (strain JCM 16519 / RA8) TaxID=662548 RepID=UPI001319ABB1|nr:DUF262 domain-containing protein [Variovorax sp. RA8]VTU42281.1 hypothetical protein RA8P1_00195 [Variovorax sp. RA8]